MVKKKSEKICKVCKKVRTKKAVKSRSKKLDIKATKKNICEFC